VCCKRLFCIAEQLAQVGLLPDELWQRAATKARPVLPDQHLSIAPIARADPDSGDQDRLGNSSCGLTLRHFDKQGKGAARSKASATLIPSSWPCIGKD